jgi:signal transduction histidine kinase
MPPGNDTVFFSKEGDHDSRFASFPFIGAQTLAAFDRLSTPLHIYCFDRQRVAWANPSALKVWQADSLLELQIRPLGPFTAATQVRLAENLEAFRSGETVDESWVFYPNANAAPALCRLSGVSLIDAPYCMLVEHLTPTGEVPLEDLRAVEALRHSPLMISLHAISGEPLMRNPAMRARFSKPSHLSDGADGMFGGMFADPAQAETLLAQALDEGQGALIAEMACSGRCKHRVDVVVVTDPATGGPALLVHQQDVSELQNVRSQLDASEQAVSFALGFNDSPVLILSADTDAVIRSNPAADRLLNETQRLDVRRLFVDPDDLSTIRTDLVEGRFAARQVALYRASGEPFWASITGQRFAQDDGEVLALILTEIKERSPGDPLNDSLIAVERGIQAMHAKLLAIASHEFRTPLAIIDSSAQRLLSRAKRIERAGAVIDPIATADGIRTRSLQIRATVQRLLRMIENTLRQAIPNQAQPALLLVPTDLGEFVAGMIGRYAEARPGASITLTQPEPVNALIDADSFEQVLTNLFDNAFKYSAGPAVITVTLRSVEQDAIIDVMDNGIGIPPDEREHIFGEFSRASNIGERPGVGIGLPLVRSIMAQHGGVIALLNSDGPGTTFRLQFPRRLLL